MVAATNPFGPMYPANSSVPTVSTKSFATRHNAPLPKNPTQAAKPTRVNFDPWNSSSTGHQRAENRLGGSTSWRDSRTAKLRSQFGNEDGGGSKRLADTVGAGSEGFGVDGRLETGGWAVGASGASGLRTGGQMSLWECEGVRGPVKPGASSRGVRKRGKDDKEENEKKKEVLAYATSQVLLVNEISTPAPEEEHTGDPPFAQQFLSQEHANDPPSAQQTPIQSIPTTTAKIKPIFRNLTIYINGSTYPLISDHKLKQLLVTHGANVSISLGRRTVTHVILGHANGSPRSSSNTQREAVEGSGGGLAASKIQKEITSGKGSKGVKFVTAEWVVECVRVGRRVPESGYAFGEGGAGLRAKGQGSVLSTFGKKDS